MRHETKDQLGASLKRLRTAAGLTQEELAERAGISARTVSDVERGLRGGVHLDTARRLASALGLAGAQRNEFEAIARGRPPILSQEHPVAGLPAVLTPFLGRTRELESIKTALLAGNVRLLTLTGPGGIGKTRLAVEAAREIQAAFPDGMVFVSLGDLRDASLVAPQIAKSLGAVETGSSFEQILTERLAGRRMLVVLDTFEHLTPAAPLVYSLLLGCPGSIFLITSRSALRLRGEQEFPVPPLESPSQVGDQPLDDIMDAPATALFWGRARAVLPDLQLDRQSALQVVEICRNLDGLPLAIELAAARVKHLPLAAIREQLDHRLELLVGGPIDLPLRQRAIRDTIAWSHDLLDGRAQTLFRRICVFAGGWSLEDVSSICGPATEVGGTLEGTSALVDQSLVVVEHDSVTARYDMLDVVREYSATRLREAGESDTMARRHALHFLTLAETAESNLIRAGNERWLQRLDVERGNLRAGIAWTVGHGETILALRYVVALWRYWRHFGELAEGRRWLDVALAMSGSAAVSLRAKALSAAAALALPQGDHERIASLASQAHELALQSDDPIDLRNALTMEGMFAMLRARYTDALEPFRECVAICLQLGLSWQLGTSYLNLGMALLHAGFRDEAVATLQEGGRVFREIGDAVFAARSENVIAHAALARDDIEEADHLARGALVRASTHNEPQGIADGLYTLAAIAAARADSERAATLAGAAAAVRETITARPAPFELVIPERFLERMERAVSVERWRHNWQAGHKLPIEAAVAYALTQT